LRALPRSLKTKQPSEGAVQLGLVRQAQDCSIPMLIEESRILQVSISNALKTKRSTADFSPRLVDVVAIAE
jgi:hypothetical protein